MDNRTLGDDIEDHFYGKHGVPTSSGSYANQVGLDEYNRANAAAAAGTVVVGGHKNRPLKNMPRVKLTFEQSLAQWIMLLSSGFVGYAVFVTLNLAWYWAAAAVLITFQGTKFLLAGPLKFMLPVLKWVIYFALVGAGFWFYGTYLS